MSATPDLQLEQHPIKRWLAFASALSAAAVSAAAWTIASAVLPQMQGDLSVSLDQVSWVVTSTVVAAAVGIPATPWLRARLGTKRLLLGSVGGFTIASGMVFTADSLLMVVVWRLAQSLIGAPLIALSQAVTLDTFKPEQRGMAFALWSMGLAAGWVFAPALGAWLAELYNWRWSFFIIAPMGLASFIACVLFVPDTEPKKGMRFDWLSYVALSVFLAAVQIVLNRGQRLDWFDSAEILSWTIAGGVGFYLYILRTWMIPNPILQWAVFKDRNLATGMVLTSLYASMGLAPLVILPTLLQRLRGVEVLTIGLMLVPRGLAQMLTMIVVGPLSSRVDPRLMLFFGWGVYALTSWHMTNFNMNIGVWDFIWPTILQGASLAFIWVPTVTFTYSTMAPALRADAATVVSLTYSIGSSIGVALCVTILSRTISVNHEELAAYVVPINELFRFPEYASQWNLGTTEGLASLNTEITNQSYMIAFVNVFWMMTMSALVALPFVALIRKPPP